MTNPVAIAAAPAAFGLEQFVALLLVAAAVALVGQRWRLPYAPGLVVTGLAIGALPGVPHATLDPHTLFTLFLPPLLFETAIHLEAEELRRDRFPIALLALGGTLVSAAVVAGLARWWLPLPAAVAWVFGALIAPTDPISVVAILKRLGVNRRLMLLIESESLLNDGVAVVLFSVLLLGATSGAIGPMDAVGRFLLASLGGSAIGAAVGWLASRVTRWSDDPQLALLLTTLTAYGAFMAAEALHTSGVVAVVAAGILVGNAGLRRGMSAASRTAVMAFWDFAAFLVNSIVFLLVGMQAAAVHWWRYGPQVLAGTAIVLVARAIAVYGLAWLTNLGPQPRVPAAWQHLLVWGGLRGALSLALALGLPADLPGRDLVVALTVGYVLFSLLVQGLTAGPLIRALGLGAPGAAASPTTANGPRAEP